MKHFMMPRNAILRDIGESQSPNPSLTKSKSQRKIKSSKENAPPPDLNSLIPDHRSSPAKLKSPLPPRPPSSNPLKRKLIAEATADNGVAIGVSDSGVKVIVRMKPPSKGEEEEMIVKKISNDALTINEQTFTFDSIADPESTQDEIFQLVGAPLVENCLAGFNSSVFAYGQTGSGKTYTMWGPANGLLEEHLSGDQRGLTPRVFELLFARLSEEQAKHAERQLKYQCRCSFLEIYNEQITDLLDPSLKNLMIREDVKSGVYVENLTEEYVKNLKDLSKLLVKGLANRRTGATSVNAESSRSHCVFTCVVESHCKSVADGLSSFKTSRINLVDLAGSERQKLTGAAGDRLKEAGNINRSLSQLGNLINILAEISQTGKQRHIPYRDSRLTFLLQESLGGNAKLAMVCAVSPSQSCRSETFSTLRFAQRAKAIQNKAIVNEVMQDDVNFLREVIRQLRDELQRVKDDKGNNPTNPNAAYTTSWNARRSLSLLRSFGLGHPKSLPNGDDDGDTEMEIDEEAVERLCAQMGLSPPAEDNNQEMSRVEKINSSLQTVVLKDESYNNSHLKSSEATDVNMEDACCQTENNGSETDNALTVAETMDDGSSVQPDSITNSLHSCISDTNQGNSPSKAENIPSCQDLVIEADVSAIIHDLKAQLQCYTDSSLTSARRRGSLLKLTYACDPNQAPQLNTIPESVDEGPEKTLEQERLRWTEAESNWISLAEELRTELDTNRLLMEKQKRELDTEKRCAEELTEAMQMAMQGHARMIEQYADLEEKHIQLLARHRRIREGIDDVKKAAARAGVKGAESRFINALAAEISALKVQREKEVRYFRDENKSLQSQLRDTAEAVQAAGELLVRFKEAEEGLTFAQKRAMDAEYEASEAYKKVDKLKRKYETEISTVNQQHNAEPQNPIESLQASCNDDAMAKYDEPSASDGDNQWREEFQPFYKKDEELSKLAEPSWFSGYDRCNI
ncbi:phragmoplast-associated kinesin-related protein [Arabidopsis thaliana]|uniref:Kinesin-like protein n=1 Tax=Arabidopsis thaliana TaxID=3702 RepID=F4J464_ARATH|nr:phragmoplast-associated kinesin-related protein [Arabidopsis thaliana]AEE76799.1 phragmoplast-associated kinesin-related protein [Arabidopsis thaliana]|eukprot:NP_001030750.1 phragmoplast-associated kinesin-related protein [Arabidopsis thaliana]